MKKHLWSAFWLVILFLPLIAIFPNHVSDSAVTIRALLACCALYCCIRLWLYGLRGWARFDLHTIIEQRSQDGFIRISHRLPKERLKQKIGIMTLTPYPPQATGVFSYIIGCWADGAEAVTWVTLGAPSDVSGPKIGESKCHKEKWEMAISFLVPINDLKAPSSFWKSLYARQQQVLTESVVIPQDVDLYERVNGEWKMLLGERRAQYVRKQFSVSNEYRVMDVLTAD